MDAHIKEFLSDVISKLFDILKAEITERMQNEFRAYIKSKLPEYYDKLEESVHCGIEELSRLREEIIQVLTKHKGELKSILQIGIKYLTREALKTSGKALATKSLPAATKKIAVNKITLTITKKFAAESGEIVATVTIKKTVTVVGKQAGKQVGKQAAKQGGKTLLKAASPLAIASDVAQAALEVTGHETLGKTVGATGNIASGAMMGFALGGPPGAIIGAAAGGFAWGAGELIGKAIDAITS